MLKCYNYNSCFTHICLKLGTCLACLAVISTLKCYYYSSCLYSHFLFLTATPKSLVTKKNSHTGISANWFSPSPPLVMRINKFRAELRCESGQDSIVDVEQCLYMLITECKSTKKRSWQESKGFTLMFKLPCFA